MNGERNQDRSARKSIRISRQDLWDNIDRLMELDKYKCSLNAVINDALYYGLPKLIQVEFNEEVEPNEPQKENLSLETTVDKYFEEIVRLFHELIISHATLKGLTSSLFEVKVKELSGYRVDPERLEAGDFKYTPVVFAENEARYLKRVRR